MTIRKRRKNEKQVIDLSGPEGNAFNLMGIVSQLYRSHPHLKDHILKEMQSGDYDNLVRVFDLYLGDHFDIVK